MNAKIDRFAGSYSFLSNFYRCPVEMDSQIYPSVEHAFQAAKTLDPQLRVKVCNSPTPSAAKYLGKRLALRKDWEQIKLQLMKQLVEDKFTRNPKLTEALRRTGEAELIEVNWWGDTFWGVCNNIGENHLGRILMEVRERV